MPHAGDHGFSIEGQLPSAPVPLPPAQAHWVSTFRLLGHSPRPLDENDWRTFAGADPGTLIVWVGSEDSRAYLLTPEGEVKELMIDGNGNTSEWMWPAKVEVNTEPDFQGS